MQYEQDMKERQQRHETKVMTTFNQWYQEFRETAQLIRLVSCRPNEQMPWEKQSLNEIWLLRLNSHL